MGAQGKPTPPSFWRSNKTIAVSSVILLILVAWIGKGIFKKNPYPGVPKQAVVYFDQGNEALAKDSIEKALNFYSKASELDDSFADLQAKTAEAYFRAGLIHKAQRNTKMKDAMFDQSRTYLDKALALDPTNGVAHLVLGLRAQENGSTEAAILELEDAESLNVKTFELHTILGYLYNEKEEAAKSFSEYEKAYRLRPTDQKTLFNLGELAYGLGHYGDAVKYYGELLKLTDKDKRYKVNYAAAVWKNGDRDKGKELFNQIINSESYKFQIYNTVAWALIDKDIDYEWGLKLAHGAEELKPNNIESVDILGWGYYKAKDYVQAVRYLNESMKQAPSDEVKKRLDMARAKLEESTKK